MNDWWDRVMKTDYKAEPGGENIASPLPSVDAVRSAWMESPEHYPAYTSHLTGHVFEAMDVFNVGGKWWYEHPAPPRKHKCEAYTRTWIGVRQVCRCACGAIGDGSYWSERNYRNAEPTSRKRWMRAWRR